MRASSNAAGRSSLLHLFKRQIFFFEIFDAPATDLWSLFGYKLAQGSFEKGAAVEVE